MPRRWIIALFLTTVVIVTMQRGVFDRSHTTFPIFRQSFHHLVAGQDLYAAYPAEQGDAPQDRFKYSPTAALLFAPFAVLPFALGLLLWNLLNAALLYVAIDRLLPRRAATVALLLVYPSLVPALQSSSSNALVAGLIVICFVALERSREAVAAGALAIGALIKVFPLAALALAFPHVRRAQLARAVPVAMAALVALPLVVTTPHVLAAQYHSWWRMVSSDAADLTFGFSVMKLLRDALRLDLPNWPLQVVGTIVLLIPLALQWHRHTDPDFRLRFLCSLLVYSVIFNHQAEFQSYVIAGTGVAVWYVASDRRPVRTGLLVLCLAGMTTLPYSLIWLVMQGDLMRRRDASAVALAVRLPSLRPFRRQTVAVE